MFDVLQNPYITIYHNSEVILNGKNIVSYGYVNIYTENITTFTIENDGLVDLHITGFSILNQSNESITSQFILDTSELSSVLAPGETTDFYITFRPTSLEDISATLYIYSDDETENPYTIFLTGSGIGDSPGSPDIKVYIGDSELTDFDAIDIGSYEINHYGQRELTIVNNGLMPLYINDIYISDNSSMNNDDFQIIAPEIPLIMEPGEKYNFFVIFKPTIDDYESIEITIKNDDPDNSEFILDINGRGVPNPVPDLAVFSGQTKIISGGTYDFGIIDINSTSQANFTIKNEGTAALTIAGYNINPPGYFVVNNLNSVTLDPGQEINFDVDYFSSSDGIHNASISINNNDPDEDPFILNVVCTGDSNPQPDISIPEVKHNGTFDFGSVLLGTSKTQTFTINNNGTAPLDISDINIGGKNASNFLLDISSTNFTIAPFGGITTIDITFNPNTNKPRTADLTINSNDPDTSNYKFKLNGQGINQDEPNINIKQEQNQFYNGATYNFGEVHIGDASDPVTFTILNNGTADLEIYSIIRTGKDIEDFVLDISNTVYLLHPNESTVFTVIFAPTKDKKFNAKIEINSNDPNKESTYKIKLTGQGKR